MDKNLKTRNLKVAATRAQGSRRLQPALNLWRFGMHISEDMRQEIDYFKRLHEHYEVKAGDKTIQVKNADEKVLYMLLSASYSMDIFEENFFENFVITDKQLTNKQELQIDAYAFIETESSNEKHLHLFQYKLHENSKHSASPTEVLNFTTLMNDVFVHPELNNEKGTSNSIFDEINNIIQKYLNERRGKKVKVKCHFINNARGIDKSNEKDFETILGRFEYDKQTKGFDIEVCGENDILDLIREGKIKVGIETMEILKDETECAFRYENNLKTKAFGLPEKVIVGICNINELIRLQNKYHHNQLYSENIRLYLGDRAAVNKDIIQTITSAESLWFPYMNNGISIICDKMELGTVNVKKKVIPVELSNLQIINGCQTVNALYSARYGEDTKDKFKSSNIMIKIYQINPLNIDFKHNVIRATNNQNAVKTYSLLANDPIQIKIQEVLKILGFLYDRKGESKLDKKAKSVSMIQSALAYRAVFELAGQKLRARIGQSRVFQKEEYERIYKNEYLENLEELKNLSVKLLMGYLILDGIRNLININADKYKQALPIIKKSTYYLSGLYFSMEEDTCNKFIENCIELITENNLAKIKHSKVFNEFTGKISKNFDNLIGLYQNFYNNLSIDKTDIDNMLKSKEFGDQYESFAKAKSWIEKNERKNRK